MATQKTNPEQQNDQPEKNESIAQKENEWYGDIPSKQIKQKKSESSTSLAEKEATGGGNFSYNPSSGKSATKASSTASNAAGNAVGAGTYGISKVYTKFLGSKKKKGGFGGLIALAVAFFILSIGSGPAQLVQIAQLMEQFHFKAPETQTDVRGFRLIRFIRSGGNVQEARVGALGSRMANKMEAKFIDAGFEPRYTGPAKFFNGFEVIEENKNFKGKDRVQIQEELAKQGIATQVEGGKLVISANEKYTINRRMTESLMKRVGYSDVASAVQSRSVAGKWFGFARWHPMRKADARINESLGVYLEKFKAKWNERVGKGSIVVEPIAGAKKPVPNCPAQGCTPAQQQAIDKIIADNAAIDAQNATTATDAQGINDGVSEPGTTAADRAAKTNQFADALKSRLLGRTAVGAFTITAAICLINEMNKSYEVLKEAKIVLPLVRFGLEITAAGNQIMNSGGDNDLDQMNGYSQILSNPKTGSWLNACSIQAELGKPGCSPSQAETDQKNDLNHIGKASPLAPVTNALNSVVPGIVGSVCSTTGQILAGVITIGLSILSGGTASIASTIVNGAVQTAVLAAVAAGAMHLFASMAAGTTVDTYAEGPLAGNNINYGNRLAASGQNLSRGGTELTAQQSAQVQKLTMEDASQDFANQSLAHRLFSPYDPRSTMAQLIDSQPTSISGNFAKISSSLFSIGKMFGNVTSHFSAVAGAQSLGTYDYGFPEYGFSADDMDNNAVYNPYDNAKDVVALLPTAEGQALMARATKCFDVNIVQSPVTDPTTGTSVNAWGVQHGDTSPNPYDKTANHWATDWNCNDQSENWLRMRFFIFDTTTMDALSCFEEDDEESCSNVGFDPPAAADAGGAVDCNASMAGKDFSAGTPANFASIIIAAAPARTCPGSPTPSGAVPNDPTKMYFASCSDGCIDQGQSTCGAGRTCVRVKYRNPPLGGNSILVYTDGKGGSPGAGGPSTPGGGSGTGVCTEFPNGRRWVGGPNAGKPC